MLLKLQKEEVRLSTVPALNSINSISIRAAVGAKGKGPKSGSEAEQLSQLAVQCWCSQQGIFPSPFRQDFVALSLKAVAVQSQLLPETKQGELHQSPSLEKSLSATFAQEISQPKGTQESFISFVTFQNPVVGTRLIAGCLAVGATCCTAKPPACSGAMLHTSASARFARAFLTHTRRQNPAPRHGRGTDRTRGGAGNRARLLSQQLLLQTCRHLWKTTERGTK